jgi:cold shock CspA family protein
MPIPAPKPGRAAKGRIVELFRGRSCGFIRARDGQTVFFHARDLERVKSNDITLSLAVVFELIEDAVSGPRAVRVRKATAAKGAAGGARRATKPAPAGSASAPR